MKPEEFKKKLDASIRGVILKLKKHQRYMISFGGDGMIWYIQEGIVLAEKVNADGTFLGTGLCKPGELLGVTSYNKDNGIISCIPLKESTLVGYNFNSFRDLIRKDCDAHDYVTEYLARRFRFMMNMLELNSLHEVSARIKYFEGMLMKLNDPEIMNINDTIVAEFIGAHPSSVSRARSKEYRSD